jgi:hypothetical protein
VRDLPQRFEPRTYSFAMTPQTAGELRWPPIGLGISWGGEDYGTDPSQGGALRQRWFVWVAPAAGVVRPTRVGAG